MGKKQGVEETSQQRAFAEIAKAKVEDARNRWAPLARLSASRIDASGAPNSAERRAAAGKIVADTNVAFAGARQAAERRAAADGTFGQAAMKLGATDMGDAQATSTGLGEVRADLGVDQARIGGLNSVVALGQGKEAGAISDMGAAAARSGQIAAADAEEALQRRIGNAALVGKVAGIGAGAYATRQPGIGQTNDFTGVTSDNALDKFLTLGTSGD